MNARKGSCGDQVFVIESDRENKQRAHVRQVESGTMIGDDIVVYSGLTAGERVAASGAFKLRDGVLVIAAAAEPERTANRTTFRPTVSQGSCPCDRLPTSSSSIPCWPWS